MSEYQYYEFVAVDGPLTSEQQGELRALSTRGRISSSSFVNDYQWGDLKADPREWMERYFDAHLYLANWGTHRIALRLPRAALDPATAARYCLGGAAESGRRVPMWSWICTARTASRIGLIRRPGWRRSSRPAVSWKCGRRTPVGRA